ETGGGEPSGQGRGDIEDCSGRGQAQSQRLDHPRGEGRESSEEPDCHNRPPAPGGGSDDQPHSERAGEVHYESSDGKLPANARLHQATDEVAAHGSQCPGGGDDEAHLRSPSLRPVRVEKNPPITEAATYPAAAGRRPVRIKSRAATLNPEKVVNEPKTPIPQKEMASPVAEWRSRRATSQPRKKDPIRFAVRLATGKGEGGRSDTTTSRRLEPRRPPARTNGTDLRRRERASCEWWRSSVDGMAALDVRFGSRSHQPRRAVTASPIATARIDIPVPRQRRSRPIDHSRNAETGSRVGVEPRICPSRLVWSGHVGGITGDHPPASS